MIFFSEFFLDMLLEFFIYFFYSDLTYKFLQFFYVRKIIDKFFLCISLRLYSFNPCLYTYSNLLVN